MTIESYHFLLKTSLHIYIAWLWKSNFKILHFIFSATQVVKLNSICELACHRSCHPHTTTNDLDCIGGVLYLHFMKFKFNLYIPSLKITWSLNMLWIFVSSNIIRSIWGYVEELPGPIQCSEDVMHSTILETQMCLKFG